MFQDWECVPYCLALNVNHLQAHQTLEHPLKPPTIKVVDSKGTRNINCFGNSISSSILSKPFDLGLDGTDPLTQFARQEKEHTRIDNTFSHKSKKSETEYGRNVDDEVPSWNSKRFGILNRFTTSEKLSIATSFLTVPGKEMIKAQTLVSDKVKYRLEQLDDFEDGSISHMMDLTQQEYIQRIDQLSNELVKSWNSDQRVKALKIAIQCSKMLSDISVMAFYPSQFVLITDILDIFGTLVYDRLIRKADSVSVESAQRISLAALRESARETCQNWFYKISSIRELIPRLYIEMAIIQCYEFISPNDFDEILLRITRMLRGIGDTLVGFYARCYLIRVGLKVCKSKEFISENLKDILTIYHTIFSPSIRSELLRQNISLTSYLNLYGPALDFILQCLTYNNPVYAKDILQEVKLFKNNGLLLLSLLHAFKPEFVTTHAIDIVQTLSVCNTDGISKSQLFRALGSSVSQCPPMMENRQEFLKNALMTINAFTNLNEFITSIETWAPFIADNFNVLEVNRFMALITQRIGQDNHHEKFYPHLQNIFDKIIQNFKDVELLLVQEPFLPFLDLFHKESLRIDVCKNILIHHKRTSKDESINDNIVLNALMYIGKILNDYVTAQTVADERRQISQLVSSFIRKVNFGHNYEQQLSFYVEARGAFANLDSVYITLVHAVNKLIMEIHRIVNGIHSRKTSSFIKGCVAFCYITIPSITSIPTQMDLYLLSGQVALLNLCPGQADACFEAALQLISELPQSIEIEGKMKNLDNYLVTYLCNMLATLVVVPDSPDQGILYLLTVLLDVMTKFPFEPHSIGPSIIYLHALDLLFVQSLEKFPYHIPNVVSNDELYGHDQKFIKEVNAMCATIIEDIIRNLKSLNSAQQIQKQCEIAVGLFSRVIRYANLNKKKIFNLALDVWTLAVNNKGRDQNEITKLITNTCKWVEEYQKVIGNVDRRRGDVLAELLNRMRKA